MGAVIEAGETAPEHGGDIEAASARYGIAAADWLDLSAALNPSPYPLPPIPPEYFQRLPAHTNHLLNAARFFYAATGAVVPAAGSQLPIQTLPLLRARGRVAIPRIGYREHAFRWRCAGHEVIEYAADDDDGIADLSRRDDIDVLVAINPNNPLGTVTPASALLDGLRNLRRRGGWLIVDEAFIDAQPEHSMAPYTDQPGLIVLRSLGKFFGLAGMRCGFALCEERFARHLRTALGPWPVNGPALFVAECALRDQAWQRQARARLQAIGGDCAALLGQAFARDAARIVPSTLFISVQLAPPRAIAWQRHLARAAVWVRLIEVDARRALLRFGLVESGSEHWRRLQAALSVPAQ